MFFSNFRFETPLALLGIVPVAAIGLLGAWRRKKKQTPTFRFPFAGTPIVRTTVARLAWLPEALRLVALSLVVIALARPQLVGAPEADNADGIDIVLALDTSCSMRAADFQPSDRMFVAKKSIQEFILGRKSDRVGLVVFGTEAASWVPLTLDYSLIARMLEEVEVGMIQDGTAIGNALATSLNRLRSSEADTKVVVLLTDGDNNAGAISPKKAAEFAKELGVKVYTILIGRGGPVPFPAGKDLWGRLVYRNQVVATNPELLEDIAKTTGGEAYHASDKAELDARLGEMLDSLEKTRIESAPEVRPYAELFPQVVFAAILALALELILASTRFRRFP